MPPAYVFGAWVGALVATFLITRIALWALKRVGDNERRIYLAYVIAFAIAVALGGFGYADGGPPRFGYAAMMYSLPPVAWLIVDLFALKGRRSQRSISNRPTTRRTPVLTMFPICSSLERHR